MSVTVAPLPDDLGAHHGAFWHHDAAAGEADLGFASSADGHHARMDADLTHLPGLQGAAEHHHDGCVCLPNKEGASAVRWIHDIFHDCVYDTQEVAGFMFWVVSTSCWLVVLVPQLVENYRRKSSEALSFAFLLNWFAGDASNLLGAVLSGDQLPTEIYTAAYFIVQDIIIISQHSFYTFLYKPGADEGSEEEDEDDYEDDSVRAGMAYLTAVDGRNCALVAGDVEAGKQAREGGAGGDGDGRGGSGQAAWAGGGGVPRLGGAVAGTATALVGASLLAAALFAAHSAGSAGDATGGGGGGVGLRLLGAAGGGTNEPHDCLAASPRRPVVKLFGTIVGYISAVLYLFSRCSQIRKNQIRRSAEGLSTLLFSFAIGGNVTYGLSILLRATGWKDVVSKMPWLLGSLGTVFLDLTILGQAIAFAKKEDGDSDDGEGEATGAAGDGRDASRVPLLAAA